jgi:acetylornithine/N-succinyldiaminopimelate aminotransferase
MQLKDVNLTAEQVKELCTKYMIETYERFPFIACRAEGMYLYDENDNAYLDFYGGIAVNNAGNCNPKVVEAVRNQVGEIMHTFNYPYTIPQAVLSELICKATGMDKVLYQQSGTEANEAMIKIARKYGVDNFGPNKFHIITATNSFHGRTYGALSATGQTNNALQLGFKPMLEGFTYVEYNNLKAFEDAITENTIAIMLEPCQGEGGVIPATQEFMTGIRKLCDDKGLLLLLDEVQTGWCRTGAIMDYMNYGIKPDCVSMAKGMGGGVPIGGMICTAKLAATFSGGTHGSTYAGNPVCCAAAYAQINELLDRDLAGNAKNMGEYFSNELRKLPNVKEVRNAGLLVGVVFEGDKAVDIKHACLDRHLLVTAIGNSIIRMVPPLIASKEDCDKCVDILKEAVLAVM